MLQSQCVKVECEQKPGERKGLGRHHNVNQGKGPGVETCQACTEAVGLEPNVGGREARKKGTDQGQPVWGFLLVGKLQGFTLGGAEPLKAFQ